MSATPSRRTTSTRADCRPGRQNVIAPVRQAAVGEEFHSLLILGLSRNELLEVFIPFNTRVHSPSFVRFLPCNLSDSEIGLVVPRPTQTMAAFAHELATRGRVRAYELTQPQATALYARFSMDIAIQRERSYTPLQPPNRPRALREAQALLDGLSTQSTLSPSIPAPSPLLSSALDTEAEILTSGAPDDRSPDYSYPGYYMRALFKPNNGTSLEVNRTEINNHADFQPMRVYLCPEEAKTNDVTTLATTAYKLLVKFIDGTSGFYPSGYRLLYSSPLDSTAASRQWFVDNAEALTRAGQKLNLVQSLADQFSEAMGVARIHAIQFVDRLPTAKNSDARQTGGHGAHIDSTMQDTFALAFLCLLDMVNHPPSWADPDSLFTLRTLDNRELAIHLNMARVALGGDLRRTYPLWLKTLSVVRTLNLGPDRMRQWETFNKKRPFIYWEESKMAAGGIPDAPILNSDTDSYDFRPRPPCLGPSPDYHLQPTWILFTPLTSDTPNDAFDSKPSIPEWGSLKFRHALQDDCTAPPKCGIVIRGIRKGLPGQCPVPLSLNLEQAMTPPYQPQTSRFAQVSITRSGFRDLGRGRVELSLVFPCSTHGDTAWHTSSTWIPLLDIAWPEAFLTNDIEGDRHPLCKLQFSVTSWPGSPMPWEFQRPFGNPDLPAQAVSARILQRTATPDNELDANGKKIPRVSASIHREAVIRATYPDPHQAASMIDTEVVMFAHGCGRYTKVQLSTPGRAYITPEPVAICSKCFHLGHEAEFCHTPSTSLAPTPDTSQCHTCSLVPDWESCGKQLRCQLVCDFDANAALMAAAAAQLSTTTGVFAPASQTFLHTLFPSNTAPTSN